MQLEPMARFERKLDELRHLCLRGLWATGLGLNCEFEEEHLQLHYFYFPTFSSPANLLADSSIHYLNCCR